MKFFNKKLFWILASIPVAASLNSCKKFLDVNTSPNSLTSSKAQYLMTGALSTSARNQITSSVHVVAGGWSGFYGHSTSYTGGGNEKTYVITNTDFDWWTSTFSNIYNFQQVINTADRDGVGFWKDPAMVMECYNYARLVDTYGNIPFSQSIQDLGNLTPAYDNGQSVYDSLIVRLDKAMANMQAATWPVTTDFSKQDIYFALNKTDWIHFANTIKLRLLLHQDFMGTRDAYIQTNIQNTASLGYMDKNVLCQPGYSSATGRLNPYYSTYGYNESNTVTGNHQYRKMNKVAINWLQTTSNDLYRLRGLAWPNGAQSIAPLPTWPVSGAYSYTGVPFGAGAGYSTAGASAMGPFYIQKGVGGSQTEPLVVMTLAESKLLQAEAVQKYPALAAAFGVVSSQPLYEAGVQAHFRLVGNMCYSVGTANVASNAANAQADAAYAAYIAQPLDNVNWTSSTDKLRAILIQKWVAFIHINGLEAWTDYRKSSVTKVAGHTWYSVPANPRSQVAASNMDEPLRMVYPQIEFITNANNVPTGINTVQSTPIFWDVNN